ncbi:MAG: DUF4430 domain-containing protein [Oscillospiraceae bacterium]|nr:DUF4430 domain-containing protein [Oscillospiraceae bacterium]
MKTLFEKNKRIILCMTLTVIMTLFLSGCNGGKSNGTPSTPAVNARTESTLMGEGSTQFDFTVVDKEGNETPFEIHTDKETVGEALSELGLIDGEEGQYGLYVKTVNGITADYDKDGVYWAFYVNDEYASAGIDSTAIKEGDSYSLRIE